MNVEVKAKDKRLSTEAQRKTEKDFNKFFEKRRNAVDLPPENSTTPNVRI
jgi:hypothetical protein